MADRNQLVNERNNLRRTYKAVMDKYQKQADTELAPIAEKIKKDWPGQVRGRPAGPAPQLRRLIHTTRTLR